jgi:aminoglycoside phosphotransferase family enzyme/predicted kinase
VATGRQSSSAITESDLHAALRRPGFYPNKPDRVEVKETHISWVFLARERAYKLKKPLKLPFVDYRTPRRRLAMCREEVRLNSRLAPTLYIGVRSVIRGQAGLELGPDDDVEAVDYVVEMRRYDEQATLAARLERGELKLNQVARVGAVLAQFHEQAARRRAGAAPVRQVERELSENIQELLALVEQRAEIDWVLGLERFLHAFVGANASLLDSRARGGSTRDGHGDLRAEHVVLGRRVEVVDCVEFNRALRQLDVADDLAFLVMDLTALGGERFAGALVRGYRRAGGDPGDDRLIAFYAVHRALVRGKVALLRAAQEPPTSGARAHQSAIARDLLMLAGRFAWRARLPLAIVVCGAPASGKSTLARALAERSRLPHISSDLTRKQLVGVPPRQHAGAAAYSEQLNARTYAALGRRAAKQIAEHGGAIIDATFRHRADREAFAKDFRQAAPLLFVECRAPLHMLEDRARRRDAAPIKAYSDATLPVVVGESAVWEPLDEVGSEAHVLLRSDRLVEAQLTDLQALLDQRINLSSASG